MDLNQLESFEAVVLHRNFTRAAEALFLTQPAVTRQIAALEADLDTRLFDRLGKTVRLTTAGEALHRCAEQMLRLAVEARDAVADISAGRAGRLAVGASSTLATYLLPGLLRRFRREQSGASGVEIAVHTGPSAQVLQMVREGDVDVGFVTADGAEPSAQHDAPAAREPALELRALADYASCVAVPPGHPLTAGRDVTAAQLAPYPLILMEAGTNLRTYVDRLLSAAGVQEQVTLELDNVEAIKRMVEAELGISILPEVSVRTEVAAGRLAALTLTDATQRAHRRIALAVRRDKYLTNAHRAFILLAEEEIAGRPAGAGDPNATIASRRADAGSARPSADGPARPWAPA